MDLKEWTIMIYMAGDNNLSVDMAYAMEQIKGIAGDGESAPNLFVYYDGNSPAIPTLYCDFSRSKDPKYVRSYTVPDKLISVPPKINENAADSRSVINFVDWCLNKVEVEDENGEVLYGRRARRYAMIFSGHSLGFADIGLFRDESAGKSMKMRDLFFMLQRLTSTESELAADAKKSKLRGDELARETTLLVGQKLDILGFDSCVMGMLEVGYQFSQVAKTMIASEGSVPNAGWTYAQILACLAQGDSAHCGSEAVAGHFVKQFIKTQDAYTVGGLSVDMAAWDLSKIEPLAVAFDGLSADLLACFDQPDSRIYRHMQRALLHVHWSCQSYMYDQNVDLGDFCELLDRECAALLDELGSDGTESIAYVRESCRKVLDALREAVILCGFSGGGYQYSNGVSIFFPWSREGYAVSQQNYEDLFFIQDVGRDRKISWAGFLKKYLNDVALRRFAEPSAADPGPKFRYYSGLPFAEFGGTAAEPESKLAGEKASKLAGEKASKLAGEKASKLAGEKASKLAGEKASKLAGEKASKLAGEKASKMAGGDSGSNQFFDNLRLFKNIEGRWNISGFSKKEVDYQSPTVTEKP